MSAVDRSPVPSPPIPVRPAIPANPVCIQARLSPDSPEPRLLRRAEECLPIPYTPDPTARPNTFPTPGPGGVPRGVAGAQPMGGDIAGVPPTAEGEGVKVYNDRTLYQEWEFIFDPQKQKRLPNPNATGAGGPPADRMNQGTQPQTTTPGISPQIGPQTTSPIGRPPRH